MNLPNKLTLARIAVLPLFIIISILSLYIVAISNLCFSEILIIKYGIPVIAIIINMLVYRKEIFYLLNFTKSIFYSIVKKVKG